MRSTTYLSWWTFKPRVIAQTFRAKLRKILLEARNEVKAAKKKPMIAATKAKRINPPYQNG